MGRCPGCGEWNSVIEKQIPISNRPDNLRVEANAQGIISLAEIAPDPQLRFQTRLSEFDRILGGGIVRRSVVLIGGDPGIGKSTLLTQALGKIASNGSNVLYVSGEETIEQLKLRSERLGVSARGFHVLVENRLEPVLEKMMETQPVVAVIDSVQSIFTRSLDAQPGSVSQVREVAARLVEIVKNGNSACIIVGHVTKDGVLAGPKILEHMVDTVVYFESERSQSYRILRAVKNRYGSVSEIGVFQMGESGLEEVRNPSELFLKGRLEGTSGSTVTSLLEGSRPILAEIQALVTGPVPGQGRRTSLGADPQRLALMLAVIEKKLGASLGNHDIFLNAVGGIRACEPAVDLAIAAAILSSYADRPIPKDTVIFGEVGLAGEVRQVARSDTRIQEAVRLGFRRIISPRLDSGSVFSSDEVMVKGIASITELQSALIDKATYT